MIVQTEAIVLRSRKQGDTSRIVTLYTKEFGILNVIAKGAREMRSPFASALQLFNHISAVFYKKENRDLYLLSKAETVTKMTGIQESLEQLGAASKIAELLLRSIHDEHHDAKLFELLAGALKQISESTPAKAAMVEIYFYYRFASTEGFALHLPIATEHGRYILNIQSGDIMSASSAPSHSADHRLVPVSARAVDILTSFDEGGITYLPSADPAVTDELESLLERYLRSHIESLQAKRKTN